MLQTRYASFLKRFIALVLDKLILQILLLPFEDDDTVETERLEKCASCFAYIDVETDQIRSIPFCIWEKYKKVIMKDIAEKYNKEGYEKGLSRKAAKVTEGAGRDV